MKRRRRRRFQSQVTVDEAVLMSNVEQEADNSKRNSEESDVVLKNQQMLAIAKRCRLNKLERQRFALRISKKIYQQRASTSSWYLELAIAKRCRLHKLIRQRFSFALWIQQMLFAMRKNSSRCVKTTSWCKSNDDQLECKSNVNQQLVATVHSDESYSRPAVDMHPVAKIQTQDNFSSSAKKSEVWTVAKKK
ncbi:hypothetical protein F511_26265 [Dorcoceras hygrometricum]|uniref:Uncharacterized protein n=1 Tax=Dorcoceras hygrometricum TaxID=472368 RepID=A0A2Z7B1F6_9LAMI|nr:hypothetical protein F511_26265 [Dorcoceras hygrometricum]